MMKRKLLAFAVAVLTVAECIAAEPGSARIHFTLDWGPAIRLLEVHHSNFLTEEGFRIDDSGASISPFINGFCNFRLGCYIGDFFSVSVGTGVRGFGPKQQVFPVCCRLDYKIKGYSEDGPISYAEAGLGFAPDNNPSDVILAGVGAGYRYTLGDTSGLELTLGASVASSHPQIWASDVRRNDALSLAVNMGIAIDF